jgi:hypothetical protein
MVVNSGTNCFYSIYFELFVYTNPFPLFRIRTLKSGITKLKIQYRMKQMNKITSIKNKIIISCDTVLQIGPLKHGMSLICRAATSRNLYYAGIHFVTTVTKYVAMAYFVFFFVPYPWFGKPSDSTPIWSHGGWIWKVRPEHYTRCVAWFPHVLGISLLHKRRALT